jgi:pimeloyl-ACP methyl ester carboxylesterase
LDEQLQIRIFGNDTLPALIYLPGLHGDWTLATGFRAALKQRVRFVEITYPRSLTWSITQYTAAIRNALLGSGITHGWLIGESFGSQFAWELSASHSQGGFGFKVDGIFLAGGFAKHPWTQGPRLMRWLGGKTPQWRYSLGLKIYAKYARFRHRHTPDTLASIGEFVSRRTVLDRQAMQWRLKLLDEYDPRPIARQTQVPVYYLAGLIDPLVPYPLVRLWLRRNCPGYRAGKTLWLADHNVLATSPARAADLIINWMNNPPVRDCSLSAEKQPL